MNVLGTPAALVLGDTGHIFTNSKHLALLAYLVLEPGEYRREHLMRVVWHSPEPGSVDNALSELRAAFGREVFPLRARKIAFDPDLVDVDAYRLLSATGDAELRPHAIELYRGPFLESFNARGCAEGFIRWVEETRVRLEDAFQQLCDEECQSAALAGDWQRVGFVAEFGMRKSPGWTAGIRWRQAARQEFHSQSVDAPDVERAVTVERAASGGSALSGTGRLLDEPRARQFRWMRSALPVLATALLAILLAIVIRGRSGSSVGIVPIPPVRTDELPAPGSRIDSLSDWLRSDGRWIYYRYERYMPAACQHQTQAVGNFGSIGWTNGVPVVCLNAAWLAIDAQRLIERFSLAPETTYCLQFLYVEGRTSFWGQHGAEGAPGLDSIRVVAPSGAYNIGFAVVRRGPGQHSVELTHRYPGPRC